MEANVEGRIKSIEMSAVVTRANGAVENHGVIARMDSTIIGKLLTKLKGLKSWLHCK